MFFLDQPDLIHMHKHKSKHFKIRGYKNPRACFSFWKLPGWRKGGVIATVGVSLVLFSTLGLIYWAVKGDSIMIKEECGITNTYSIYLKITINILSAIVLSASSYFQQCLSSPTRAEINEAHKIRKALDIGT